MSGVITPYPLWLDEALTSYLTGRGREVQSLADAVREGELVIVCAADPTLASAMADAAAVSMLHDDPVTVRADARLATDETDLARAITQAAIVVFLRAKRSELNEAALARVIQMVNRGQLSILDANETPAEAQVKMSVRRMFGEQAYALAAGEDETSHGIRALTLATESVLSLRGAIDSEVLLLLHGVDELWRPGRSRFTDGNGALWAIRGVWQREHGPALLSGGQSAAAMAADEGQALYGYGQLHEVRDLPEDRLAEAFSQQLADKLTDDAVREAQSLIGQALWLLPALRSHLPARKRQLTVDDLHEAWEQMVALRVVEHHQLLRALSRVHRLAVPVLESLARGQGPYAALGPKGKGRRDDDIARALLALESCAAIHRLGGGRWRLADPTLQAMLGSARATSADFRFFAS